MVGIKPTRLWHLTGKKHYQYMIENRRVFKVREPPDAMFRYSVIMAASLASCLGIGYTYGWFSPPKDCEKAKVEKPPPPCPKELCPPPPKVKPAPKCPSCSQE